MFFKGKINFGICVYPSERSSLRVLCSFSPSFNFGRDGFPIHFLKTRKYFLHCSWCNQMSDMPPRMQTDRSGG